MTIPRSCVRAHVDWDDPRCDTVAILNIAAKHSGYADMNACALADGDANVHWADGPLKNHYDHIWTGRRDRRGREIRRPMTSEERHRPLVEWKVSGFLAWRRGERGGPRPHTVEMRQRQAKAREVTICWELKSRQYKDPARAQRFVAACRRAGGVAYFMTLVTMRAWGPKLRAFKNAGGETALLAHGVRLTALRRARLAFYSSSIDRIWGDFAERRRT